MTCKEAVGRITDYYEGVLSPSEAQEIQAHLATCDNCHTYFEQSRQLTAALGKLPDPAPLSAKAKSEILTAFREQQARKSRFTLTRPWAIGAAAAMAVIAIMGGIWIHQQSEIKTPRNLTIDLSQWLLLRGPEQPAHKPVQLERAPLNLTIRLPLGNEPGEYQVAVRRGGTTLVEGTAEGKFEDHITILHLRLDCRNLKAGRYSLAIRKTGWEWREFPAVVP